MRRVVIDTNVYVDWMNAGRHELVLFQRDAVKYLSAVVMLELYAGAFSPRDRRVVRSVVGAGGVEELAASVGAVLHIGDERHGQQRRPEVVDGLREAREPEPADLPALCELR